MLFRQSSSYYPLFGLEFHLSAECEQVMSCPALTANKYIVSWKPLGTRLKRFFLVEVGLEGVISITFGAGEHDHSSSQRLGGRRVWSTGHKRLLSPHQAPVGSTMHTGWWLRIMPSANTPAQFVLPDPRTPKIPNVLVMASKGTPKPSVPKGRRVMVPAVPARPPRTGGQ